MTFHNKENFTTNTTQHLSQRLSKMITQMELDEQSDYYTIGWNDTFEDINSQLEAAISSIAPLYNSLVKNKVCSSFYYDCQDVDDLCELYGLTSKEVSFILREGSKKYFTQR